MPVLIDDAVVLVEPVAVLREPAEGGHLAVRRNIKRARCGQSRNHLSGSAIDWHFGQFLFAAGDAVEQFLAGADDHLGGGRGRGRAQVGHEIRDGHIGFMTYGGNYGDGATRDGAGDGFFVEGP